MSGSSRFWERVLAGPTRTALRHPWLTLAVALALSLGAALAVVTRLELRTSNLDLVDPDLPEVARFRAFAASFGTPNLLVVVLEGEDPAGLARAAARAAPAIAAGSGVRAVLYRLPFRDDVLFQIRLDAFFRSRDGKMLFLLVQPDDAGSSAATIAPFVEGVRAAIAGLALEREGIRAGFTGLPQYALDDRDVVRRDITRLSGLSFGLVLAIFVIGYRGLREPALAMAVLSLAALWTAGIAAIAPGHLTMVSAFFFSILFGLGIDFGIRITDRAAQLRDEGLDRAAALAEAVRFLAPGLGTGSATTAASFLLLVFSGFRGFAELGVLAGVGVILAVAGMVTVLPALLVLLPESSSRRSHGSPLAGRFLLALVRPAVALPLLGLVAFAAAAGPPPFDGDYLDLQPKDSPTVRLDRAMVERSSYAPQFAVFVAPDAAAARRLADRLRQEPLVSAVRSAADFDPFVTMGAQIPGEWERFRALYVAPDGRQAVYAFPRGDIWDPAFQARFLSRLRAIDPAATGMPYLGSFFIALSKHALRVTAALAALMLLALVAMDFDNPWRAALAIGPTFAAVAAMLGGMRLLGVPFNPLNVLALPIVLGVAEDSAVHLVHRFVAERGDIARTLAGTGRTIFICGLTTLVGFGALAFADHRGLASFALAISLGVGVALALSLFVLPWLLVKLAPRILRERHPEGA